MDECKRSTSLVFFTFVFLVLSIWLELYATGGQTSDGVFPVSDEELALICFAPLYTGGNLCGTLYNFSGGDFQRTDTGGYAGTVFMPMMNIIPFKPLSAHFTLRVHVS